MSNLIGAVSLTDKQGLFLGSVNIDNLNLNPDELVYTQDGVNLEGLNLGAGLEKISDNLETVGNPDIQLVSNSIYVNDNVGTTPLQTAINTASQGDVIYISSGSFGEAQVNLSSSINIALLGPPVGSIANTICEILNGFNITSTSESVRFANLQIKGTTNHFNGVGRHKFQNCIFTGTALQSNNLTFGANSTNFISLINCEFDQYCSITVPLNFSSVIYFINCNFSGATITLNNASNLQVIFNNCTGFTSYPASNKSTLIGLNILTSGLSQVNTYDLKTTLINGSAYPPSSGGVSVTNQNQRRIPYCTTTNNVLDCEAAFHYNPTSNTLGVDKIETTDISGVNLIITNINGSPYNPSTSISTNINVCPMWYATPKIWVGDNINGYIGGSNTPTRDYNGQYKILASSTYPIGNYQVDKAFDRDRTTFYAGNQSGYLDTVIIQKLANNTEPDSRYIYIKCRTDSVASIPNYITIDFSNDNVTYTGETNLYLQLNGNAAQPGFITIENYNFCTVNYVIPELYSSYSYIRLKGTATTMPNEVLCISEVNLLYPAEFITNPFYASKPYLTQPPTNDDLCLNGNTNTTLAQYDLPSFLFNGTNAFYINLSSQSFVEITASIACSSNGINSYPLIIGMWIDNTITTNPTEPKASTYYKFTNSATNYTMPEIKWSGTLLSGYHIITFSQYSESENVNNTSRILFSDTTSININCIARN